MCIYIYMCVCPLNYQVNWRRFMILRHSSGPRNQSEVENKDKVTLVTILGAFLNELTTYII
jgi:hypothetical protein